MQQIAVPHFVFRSVLYIGFMVVLATLGTGAMAQSPGVDELTLSLRTDAFVSEEPLGTIIQCGPYETMFPDKQLKCVEIVFPVRLTQLRFEAWVRQQPGLAWQDDWQTVDLPDGVEAGRNDSLRRTLESTDGREYVIAIFDLRRLTNFVVAGEPD